MAAPRRVLALLALGQLLATSVWFAINAVLPSLAADLATPNVVADMTTAVQLGFVFGTLVFALLTIADRYSPSKLLALCSLLAGLTNLSMLWLYEDYSALLAARFVVGFLLAGIYPVGMKVAVSWFPKGLGMALGLLVGALVLGTALPHLLRALGQDWPWQQVVWLNSLAAVLGGLVIWLGVGDGPNISRAGALNPRALFGAFKSPAFRASALGYFGHMWELYTFWALLPIWLALYAQWQPQVSLDISWWSFVIIGVGAIGCIYGGHWSNRLGSWPVALGQLSVSGVCCLLSPLMLLLPFEAFIAAMLIWGISVAGDSPQFSTLNAQGAPAHLAGSALTLVNCVGFAISVASLQWVPWFAALLPEQYLLALLLPGPLLGVWLARKSLLSVANA